MARTTAEQRAENRARLIAAGRAAFLGRGFEAASNDDIAEAAGLTRGALHYQFKDKRGLFEAVFLAEAEAFAAALSGEVMEHVEHSIDEVEAGCDDMLDLFARPDMRRILLEQGPAVLGVARWRELLGPPTIGLIAHALGHWADAGLIAKSAVAPYATMLWGAVQAVAQEIAASDDPDATIAAHRKSMKSFARRLRGAG